MYSETLLVEVLGRCALLCEYDLNKKSYQKEDKRERKWNLEFFGLYLEKVDDKIKKKKKKN